MSSYPIWNVYLINFLFVRITNDKFSHTITEINNRDRDKEIQL